METKRPSILMIAMGYAHNRQAVDLARVLVAEGFRVILVQGGRNGIDPSEHIEVVEVQLLRKWGGRILGIPGISLLAMVAAVVRVSLRYSPDAIVALLVQSLIAASIVTALRGNALAYYSVEVGQSWLGRLEGFLCRRFAKLVIGVERNRLAALMEQVGTPKATALVFNAPRTGLAQPVGGALKQYLRRLGFLRADDRIVLFHGSYQKYAHLEEIVAGGAVWDADFKFVLMVSGRIPPSLEKAVQQCERRAILVPPVDHTVLFSWVADADVGMLPYEDADSFEVRYCSPQKLFDYLACGVPIVGSNRPLIREVVENLRCGHCTNMLDSVSVNNAIRQILRPKDVRPLMSESARKGYECTYNYETLAREAIHQLTMLCARRTRR